MALFLAVIINLIGVILESILLGFMFLLFIAATWIAFCRFVAAESDAKMGQPRKRSLASLLVSYFSQPLHVGPVLLVLCATVVRGLCFDRKQKN